MLGTIAPVVVLFMMASAIGIGLPVIQYLAPPKTFNGGERALLAGLIGSLLIAAVTWMVGAWTYSPLTMRLTLIGFCASALYLQRNQWERYLRWRPVLPSGLWRLVPGGILLLIGVGIIGCYAPPSDHDTLRYHLTLPHRDLAWGKIAVYFGWSVYEFSPPLGGLLTRLVYAISGPVGAQLLHLMWEIVAAASAALIARRLGLKAEYCWLAALILLGQRVSINLASVASVEFTLAAFAGGAAVASLGFIRNPNHKSGILLGVIIGGLINVKLHGLVYAACLSLPLVAYAIYKRNHFAPLLSSLGASAALFLPVASRNFRVTGNPVFPTFNELFGDGYPNLFGGILKISRDKTNVENFLTLPWDMFVNQNQFDGLQFGLPIILILLPFSLITKNRKPLLHIGVICIAYLALWFLIMPHFLRFLIPIFPLLTALAAAGASTIALATQSITWRKQALGGLAILLAIGQLGFLGATAARRLPAAFGIHSPTQYLTSPAFQFYAQYDACTWALSRLKPSETYLPLLNSPSYYCPPERAFPQLLPGDQATIYTNTPRPRISANWFADQLEVCKVRFIIVPSNAGNDSEPYVFAKHRYIDIIRALNPRPAAIQKLKTAYILSGPQVVNAIRMQNLKTATTDYQLPAYLRSQTGCVLIKPYRKIDNFIP